MVLGHCLAVLVVLHGLAAADKIAAAAAVPVLPCVQPAGPESLLVCLLALLAAVVAAAVLTGAGMGAGRHCSAAVPRPAGGPAVVALTIVRAEEGYKLQVLAVPPMGTADVDLGPVAAADTLA